MIDELELLRQHLDETAGPAPDLAKARAQLEFAIAAAGPKPRTGLRPVGPKALTVSGLVAVAAAAVLLALTVFTAPPPRGHARSTPAVSGLLPVGTQLRLLSDRIAQQDVPSLQGDQLLLTDSHVAVQAQVNNGQAQATIAMDVKRWSNGTGQACTSTVAQPAQFATPAQQAAWSGLGLLDAPMVQPVTGCLGGNTGTGGQADSLTGDGQLIDVSKLPTDPTVLAQELQNGTTGIPAIDQLTFDQANATIAFQRAAVLLLGPTVGATPKFESTLYQALALLPGVISLGSTTTHDGQAGIGFAADSQEGQSAIVVDPVTGQLLELRNFEDSSALSSLAIAYLGGGPLQVTSYGSTLQWLDPVGQPAVVKLTELPADEPVVIFGTAKPGIDQQLLTLQRQLEEQYGHTSGGSSFSGAGALTPGTPATIEWSFSGPGEQFNEYLAATRASGLFSSVNVI
ncbi:MAG TPA: hypothetical protein VG346_15305 [Acidimicrobiales bacterium]|jgi:hypothetical protein|nr:hypothetical protein [Acidimicrobiales bacterium]